MVPKAQRGSGWARFREEVLCGSRRKNQWLGDGGVSPVPTTNPEEAKKNQSFFGIVSTSNGVGMAHL